MRTRRITYPDIEENELENKRRKISPINEECSDLFDKLPDGLVLVILCKITTIAESPSDFINASTACKRFHRLGGDSLVLSNIPSEILAIKAKNWSDSAHRFLKRCAATGNVEACYTLGMILFYALEKRHRGVSLMAKAAIKSHAPSLYSLGVLQFNGSGGSNSNKDLRAGVALCAHAAFLGHIDALRELGHSLLHGYGVQKNTIEGRNYIIQANARELLRAYKTKVMVCHRHTERFGCPLMSDVGCNVPLPEPHPVMKFLREWFDGLGDLDVRMCCFVGCGRWETRKYEFRSCSTCQGVNYCSRACQALDWKWRHHAVCR